MNYDALSVNEMLKYEAVMKDHEAEILGIKNVRGLGIGFRHGANRRLDSAIVLVVVITPEYESENTAYRDRVKSSYGFLQTQIIKMPKIQDQAPFPFIPMRKRFEPVDPIVGGVEIGNSNLCSYKSGVLGAIVFDKKSGEPLGLSVQHAIGDHSTAKSLNCDCDVCAKAKMESRGKISSWWVPAAKPNDPISQPNSFDSKNKIGTLLKFDKKFDAAIFKLNTEREIQPRVNGLPGEVNEPIKPTLGMNCLFRGAKTHTSGRIWFVGKLRGDQRLQVSFEITGNSRTSGGDSGGLWVTEDGLHPIGLHTGQVVTTGYAVATSMQQLVDEFHPFTFQPVQYKKLIDRVSRYHTAFCDAPDGNGLFTFCCSTTGTEPLKVQRYSDVAKPVGRPRIKSDVDALNGLSAACLRDNIYAVWRSMTGDEIKVSRWSGQGVRQTVYGLASYRTVYRPVVVNHKDRIFMAYVDRDTRRIRLLVSDGNNWNICWHQSGNRRAYWFGGKCRSAPSLASYKGKLLMTWVGQTDGRINLMDISPSLSVRQTNRASRVVRTRKLPAQYLPSGDVALAVTPTTGELTLAMTAPGGALQAVALPIAGDWTGRTWKDANVMHDEQLSPNPPSLFCHDGRVICSREQ